MSGNLELAESLMEGIREHRILEGRTDSELIAEAQVYTLIEIARQLDGIHYELSNIDSAISNLSAVTDRKGRAS